MFTKAMPEGDDLDLVNRSRSGDRDAFGELVARYQSLVCSLAYSATGNLGQSEDLAQETFVTAWRQLPQLREPAKVRSWLCGIARNLTNNSLRKQGREPVHQAAPIEALANNPSPEPWPAEAAVTREEEALLWRALEQIPDTYREPLVLFYRERQSVEAVSRALELSEEAVKQRLSRGRKLLREEMASFVEHTLTRSAPGRAFTLGVVASLPAFAVSASAAGLGATAAKGTSIASSAAVLMALNAILGPIIGIAGAYIGVKASINATRTPRERQFMIHHTKRVLVATVLFNIAIFTYLWFVMRDFSAHPRLYVALGILIPVAFTVFIGINAARMNRQFQKIRGEEIKTHPDAYSPLERAGKIREYRSKASFLGLPLVHARSGFVPGVPHQPAMGWIALGDKAYGILFAAGGLAVGGIAVGGASIGLISLGGAALGAIAFGGLAIGGLALGGGALGIVAIGGGVVAWTGALGGLAIAREFALGGLPLAAHANDALAAEFFRRLHWLDFRRPEIQSAFGVIGWLPLLLILCQARRSKRAQSGNSRGETSPDRTGA